MSQNPQGSPVQPEAAPHPQFASDPGSGTPVQTVCMVGLGAMGLPMALRLAERFDVTATDVSAERRDLAASAGLEVSADLRAAVHPAQVVFAMVRTPEQLMEALFGPNGIAAHLRPEAVVIVSSTVGAEGMEAAAARLRALGHSLADAPVSGGPLRAENGDLLITVGADPHTLSIVRPVLAQLASTLTVVGDRSGTGQIFKTVNQLLCGVHIAAAAEALALAQRLGLDPRSTLAALQAGAAASFMLGDRGPRICEAIAGSATDVASRLDLFVKDLGIVTNAAAGAGLNVPVATAAARLFEAGESAGLSGSDDSHIVRVLLGAPTDVA